MVIDRFRDEFFSREQRYSIGIDTKLGGYFLSIPVSNGIVDYEEYYSISDAEHSLFLEDAASASQFAESCRRHRNDAFLLHRPGWNRGTPV